MPEPNGGWCNRVTAALADGRFAENPGPWKDHLKTCDGCRRQVEAVSAFRDLVARAEHDAPEPPGGPSRARQVMEEAFRRYEASRKRRRFALGGFGLVLVLCVAGVLLLGGAEEQDAPGDAIAYARTLYEHVYPAGEAPRYARLGEDGALREEFLRALDHPESLVRRTALHALLMSNVAVDPAYLEDVLIRADETLERPIEVADRAGAGRWLAEALQTRRIATVQSTLFGLGVRGANGATSVEAMTIERFLAHPDVDVRHAALYALTHRPGYAPGPAIVDLMRSDPGANVRGAAASLLIRSGDADARDAVLEHLRTNEHFDLEDRILPALGEGPEAVAFYEERFASPDVRSATAMAHLYRLVRAGRVTEPPRERLDAVLREGDADAVRVLAWAASKADWVEYRGRLQETWRAERDEAGEQNDHLGPTLVHWDLQSGDPVRLESAREIVGRSRSTQMGLLLHRLAASESIAVRDGAKRLLEALGRDE